MQAAISLKSLFVKAHVYAYCDTCRRWVRIEDGRWLASGRWLCNDCMMVARRKVRRAQKKEAQRHAAQ